MGLRMFSLVVEAGRKFQGGTTVTYNPRSSHDEVLLFFLSLLSLPPCPFFLHSDSQVKLSLVESITNYQLKGKTNHWTNSFTQYKALSNIYALSLTGVNIVGVQNTSPQDMPLWYVDYFELKAAEALQAQEKLLPFLNYLEKCKWGALPI